MQGTFTFWVKIGESLYTIEEEDNAFKVLPDEATSLEELEAQDTWSLTKKSINLTFYEYVS